MKSANTSRESQRVGELAAEYERKGYSVTLPRQQKDTPEFLHELGYTPDLIARSGDETLVIEVKSRETSATLASLSNIAERVNAKPGWQFVLVFTNPRNPPLEAPRVTPDKVTVLLEKSRAMGYESQSHQDAAFLFAWVALEAALLTLPPTTTTGRNVSTPWTLIRNAAMNGLVAREDAHTLERLFKIRNSLLHAGDDASPTRSDIDSLRRIAEEVLHQRERDEA
jgi:Holliday junction resolvase-like predicted endonuclease